MNKEMLKTLENCIGKVEKVDEAAVKAASDYNDLLVKPPHSMGELENIAIKLSGITGHIKNKIGKKTIYVLCADNGVVEEGVASSPVSVTAMQALNMTRGLTGVAVLARHTGTELVITDMGIATDYSGDPDASKVIDRSIRRGTGNIVKEPAMTEDECLTAITTGINLVVNVGKEPSENKNVDKSSTGTVDLIGVGEMGVGNTTTSTALLSALTGVSPEDITGRGAGLTDEALVKKKEVIRKALEFHGLLNKKWEGNENDAEQIISAMSKVGGLDIAAMCGTFIGAAICKKAVVIDGIISAVAALCAVRLCPLVKGYLFTSHVSKEPAYDLAIKELELKPYLMLNMGLGEGSGCPMAFQIIEDACVMMRDMATFEGGGIDDSYLEGIR